MGNRCSGTRHAFRSNVAAELQKFYDAAHRAPLYICYFHEDDGTVTESHNLFF